ncbi:acyl carrier protein [Streptomyces sp. NPDC058257]|uniref:acyl carrier protein n=1 Tax=Streptomyces sp. NPDC058257 TaxID=3346409 RepID=UPI0036E76795
MTTKDEVHDEAEVRANGGQEADDVAAWAVRKLAVLSIPSRPEEEITPRQSLTQDLGVDSLAFIEALVSFEEEFAVRLDEDRLLLSSYDTIQDLCDYLRATRIC